MSPALGTAGGSCPGSTSRLSPVERGHGAQTYLSVGAPLTHGAVSHRGGITRHRERLQEAGAYVV